MKERTSRHPKIQYWSLNEEDILSENYKEVIDRIRQNGCFDTLCISCWKMNLWDLSTKPLIGKVVRYAHDKGIRTPLQVFPKGYHTKWRLFLCGSEAPQYHIAPVNRLPYRSP